MTIRELQDNLKAMLCEFDRYCCRNRLTYFLDGGSLLGAVREKGFIPWDDDLDIAMPRADYERFLESYDGPLTVKAGQEAEHKPTNVLFTFAKLFPENAVVTIEDEELNIHADGFLQIDLYPIDPVGNDLSKAERIGRKVQRLEKMLYLIQSTDESPHPLKRCLVRALRRKNPARVVQRMDRIKKSYLGQTSKWATRWRTQKGKKVILPAQWFERAIEVPFEDQTAFIPNGFEEYLRLTYGDDFRTPKREDILRHDTKANTVSEKLAEELKES